jgi:hypothetical protein|tara:strand:+ start:386 stop:685 length:300 start_codon:yes stop_codon:yes gene_type:complete
MTVEIDKFESWQWDDQLQEVRFQILDIDRLILCRISRGFIDSYLKLPFANANLLDMVKEHINLIIDLISLKAVAGRFEKDDSILIRSIDGLLYSYSTHD